MEVLRILCKLYSFQIGWQAQLCVATGKGIDWLQKGASISLRSPFKFTEDLQTRLETLLEKHKSQTISETETAEFAGITELDRIFTRTYSTRLKT